MNEYLIVFCKDEDNKVALVSQTYTSKLPLCSELVKEIFEYIKTSVNTKSFALMNIVCLSKQKEKKNKKLKK